MQKQIPASINPKMLKWMRESSNLTIDEIIKKSKLKKNLLLEAEQKNSLLTTKQVRKLAQIYNRPLASFYLDEIPEEKALPDFRTKMNKKLVLSNEVQNIVREHEDKKRFAEELYTEERIEKDYSFIGKFNENNSNIDISTYILDILQVRRDEFTNKKDNEVLNIWKEKVESIGILVFQFQKVNESITRGFSIADPPMPILAINQKDSYYARAFTLIHELAHILLNKSGVCDSNEQVEHITNIEAKCNAIASLTLVPPEEFKEQIKDFKEIEKELTLVLDTMSKYFKVSWSVILIRLKEEGLITHKTFMERNRKLLTKKRKEKTTGGDYYRLLLSSTSITYYKMVLKALKSDTITFYDAMNYLHVSFKVMKNFEERGDSGEV